MTRHRIRENGLPPSLKGWVLLDDAGLPRFWPVVWADVLKAGAEEGTLANHLAGVDRLYKAGIRIRGCDDLDAVIAAGNFDALEAVLGGFLAELRNEAAVRRVDLSGTWQSAMAFATDLMRHHSASAGADAAQMLARLTRLEHLYAQVAPRRKSEAAPIRALPGVVVEDLHKIFDPKSERNPFRTDAQKARNYLLFILYLHLGLRRGEALVLAADAFKTEFDHAAGRWVRWLNVVTLDDDEQADPRAVAPSLKTPQSQRQIPLTQAVLDLCNGYVANWRGKANHRFLFTSQKGHPLAAQTVGDTFSTVTAALSQDAQDALRRRGKASVTPHDLRHTSVVVRLKRYKDQGMETSDALGKLRSYFGWSHASTMPTHYARAYWQTDASEATDEKFDAHVEAMRQLDGKLEGLQG